MDIVRKLSRTWEDKALGHTGRFMTLRQEVMNAIFMLQVAVRNGGGTIREHYTFGDNHTLKFMVRPCPWVLFYDGTTELGEPINPEWVDGLDLITGAGQLEFVHGVRETSGTSV